MPGQPKYQTVAATLRREIAEGVFGEGQLLMTEEELKGRFGVSRQTVRQAIAMLEDDGLVVRRLGSGTYVKHGPRRHGETLTVGVVTTYITDYIFPSIVRGIESVLSANGCIMNLSATYNRVDHERAILQRALDSSVDGLIIEGTKTALPNPNIPFYQALREKNIPVVFINGRYAQMNSSVQVVMDDYNGGILAARTLLDKGFQRIGGVFKRDDVQGHERFRGVSEMLLQAGQDFPDDRICWFGTESRHSLFQEADGLRLLNSIQQPDGPDAIVCYNDEVALSLCAALRERGCKVPRDVAIISFDNSAFAGLAHPALTTLNHPKDDFGALAAQKLLHMISGAPEESAVLPWQLIERESLGR